MKFREIDTGLESAAWNVASDEVLLESVVETREPGLRFLSFEPCVLVGYFQSVEQEIRTDYCEKKGIAVNRRITGGGSLYFDPSQVGWEIIAPHEFFKVTPAEFYELFGSSVAEGLRTLGIPAEYKPRNDIEVRGRKISGMGGVNFRDSFLFQGTLLVEDKIEEMLYSLRVPIEKLKPKEIDSVRERVTCVEHELGRIPSREEIKDAIRLGFQKTLGIETAKAGMLDKEKKDIEKSLPYYSSSEWVHKVKLPVDSQGVLKGTYRSPFGTIKVNATINAKQRMLRSTIITGDFFMESLNSIYDLERLLKNIPFEERRVLSTINDFFRPYKDIPSCEFVTAFREVFKKWLWVAEGFSPDEANRMFAVNFLPGEDFNPTHFFFPYCSKEPECSFRRSQGCPKCGKCSVGEGFSLAESSSFECVTILSFEDLLEKFKDIRAKGATDYIGSCCEPFYVKHQEEFRESGLRGLLIDIKDSTCYDLGKARKAYAGRFENQTNLDIELIKRVLIYLQDKFHTRQVS